MSSLLCPPFFADKHFHIGTLDDKRAALLSKGEEFVSQAKKRPNVSSSLPTLLEKPSWASGVLVGVFSLVGLGLPRLPKIFPGVKLTQSSVFRQRVYWASCVTSMTSIVWFMCLISRLRELDDWIDEILCSTSSLLVLPPNFMRELTSNGEILWRAEELLWTSPRMFPGVVWATWRTTRCKCQSSARTQYSVYGILRLSVFVIIR